MKTIATICARGGSKGLPGKNIRSFLGTPLLARSIRLARACAEVEGVFVSTDSTEIAEVAEEYGATVLGLRPSELATDSAPKLPALLHLVDQVEAQFGPVEKVVDLQPTSPLTALQDLRACIEASDADPSAGLVTTAFDSGGNPYFTMVEVDSAGYAHLSKASTFTRRQDAPRVLTLNGAVYVWRKPALVLGATRGMWCVPVRTIEMPRCRSVDIDDAEDWELAQFWASRGEAPR